MKLTALLLVVSIFSIQANVYSQKDKVTLNLERVETRKVLETIESQTGLKFFYNNKKIDVKRVVTVSVANTPVSDVLDLMFDGTPVYYILQKRQVILKLGKAPQLKPVDGGDRSSVIEEKEVFQRLVSGSVSDENGVSLPGANVVEKGTTNGVTADFDGNFSLEVSDDDAVLVISYIGYATKELAIDGKTSVKVVLVESAAGLEEIVVVGYGTQSKRKVTGAITSIKAANLENNPVSQVDALLQGRASGVQVVQNSGAPGAEIFVRVRGSGSLLGESRPLYVIDGVAMNNVSGNVNTAGQRPSALGDINPNDIESMEILKDAAATAIYGARGSNGVVLITTKSGKDGKARFNFDTYTGTQSVSKKYDLLNGQQFVDLIDDERINRGQPVFDELGVTGINTDWQDEIFQNAMIQNYNLSVSGGTERLKSFMSVGYFDQDGTIIGQTFKRLNFRANVDYRATDKLKVGTSIVLSRTGRDVIANDYSGYSVLGNALLRNPNLPVYEADGSYSVDPLLTSENPVQLANEITNTSVQKRVIANQYGEWEIMEGLKLRSSFGFDNLGISDQYYAPSYILGQNGVASASATRFEELTWQNENTLTYTKNMVDHSFSGLLGLSYLESEQNYLQAGGRSSGSDLITTLAIAIPGVPQNYITNWGLVSYFGRINYDFRDKYLVNASLRADGSSRFGANKKFGVFPSFSAGWRISSEDFMENVTAISDLKLRASYGETGNQDGISNFPSLALYGTGRNYDGVPGIAQSQLANEDLGWESTIQTNVGLDFGLFNGRFNLNVDYYNKETKDLIFTKQLPWTSGFSQINRANLGNLRNKGLDLGLFTRNLTGNFTWSTDFNISFNENEITFLPENGASGSDFIYDLPDAYGSEGPYSIYRVGESVGSFYGYNYQGVYASDSDVPQEFFDKGVRGGDVIYEDINGDGAYSRDDDRKIIGNALPKFTGGMNNTFGYKGFELSVFMNWSYGNDIYNMTDAVLVAMSEENNQSVKTLDRWKQQGQVTNIPRAIYGSSSVSGAANTDASSRYLEDGSFLRIKNVNLGYTIPADVSQSLGLNTLRFYIAGQNLWTFTKYSGYDPESQNVGTGVPSLGVDYLTQPIARTYMLGVNLSF